MGKRNSTKTTVPTCLLPKGEHKQYIRGTVIFDGNKFYIKSRTGNFRLLPQGRIFICFSGNTSEEVLSVQNELLLENLRPDQIVEWQPMAWNAVGNISTFGEVGNAQNAIDKFADNADHIVFVVKDEIYEGLLHEWELWTSCPQGKKYTCLSMIMIIRRKSMINLTLLKTSFISLINLLVIYWLDYYVKYNQNWN